MPVQINALGLALAEGDASLGEVVRCQFYGYRVASQYADIVFAHFARNMGCDDMPVFQFDAKHGIRQSILHHATHFDMIAFGHILTQCLKRVIIHYLPGISIERVTPLKSL